MSVIPIPELNYIIQLEITRLKYKYRRGEIPLETLQKISATLDNVREMAIHISKQPT